MKRRHTLIATGAAGALILGGLVIATLPASAAVTGCSVAYKVQSEWPGGFTADLAITNLGSPVRGWTATFDFPNSDQKVTNGWSATWAQSGTHVSATNLDWNGTLDTSGSASIGFNGAWKGANPQPASVALNGVTCTGSVTSPTPSPTTTATGGPSGPAPELKVSGNRIVTASGKPYRLLGVDRSSGEYACVQGKGLWDGGPVDQASVDAMKTWNIHAVRVPLNEECWLGLNGSPKGAAYQQGVKDYVNLLVANGITPILDLHWTRGAYTNGPDWHCKDATATCQKPMPDAQYAPSSGPVSPTPSRAMTPSSSICSTSRTRRSPPAGTRPSAGSAGATAAPARASRTRRRACRTWSTRSGPPARPTSSCWVDLSGPTTCASG